MDAKKLEAALNKAFELGKNYYQQWDSEDGRENLKTSKTGARFGKLKKETLTALKAAAEQEPVGWCCFERIGDGNLKVLSKFSTREEDVDRFVNAHQARYADCGRKKIALYAAPPAVPPAAQQDSERLAQLTTELEASMYAFAELLAESDSVSERSMCDAKEAKLYSDRLAFVLENGLPNKTSSGKYFCKDGRFYNSDIEAIDAAIQAGKKAK